MRVWFCASTFWAAASILLTVAVGGVVRAEPVVPGTGQKIQQVGDDFEDPDWEFKPNSPKSSQDLDDRTRAPTGYSTNRRWYEGAKRGYPDVVRRVETPPGGLLGSQGSLLLRTLHSGVPGSRSYKMGQDDFIGDVSYRLGGKIPVWQTPSVVTRVFMPPVDEWENRSGPHFGFRAAVDTRVAKEKRGFFSSGGTMEREVYWPGFFIDFESRSETGKEYDYARFRIRGDEHGRDVQGPQITQTGWWTLGMSFTPDGKVHYYAKPGVEDLTEEDYITTQSPYSFRCERLKAFFFNVCNRDDGRSWSTSWIVDDPTVYYIPKEQLAGRSSSGRK